MYDYKSPRPAVMMYGVVVYRLRNAIRAASVRLAQLTAAAEA